METLVTLPSSHWMKCQPPVLRCRTNAKEEFARFFETSSVEEAPALDGFTVVQSRSVRVKSTTLLGTSEILLNVELMMTSETSSAATVTIMPTSSQFRIE
jgi:hypothetical protein